MRKIIRVGVDLAKNVIQVHAVDEHGTVVVARALRREKFITWCVQLPAGCLIAMEACSGAHHWCRKLQALVDNVSKNAPAGSESAVALVKSALSAANNAYDSVQKATKQAVELAESNFHAAANAASKATAQAS